MSSISRDKSISASQDVISNLLASFSAISLPPDEPARDARYPVRDPVSAPRTPPRTLSASPTYQRSSHLHIRPRDSGFESPRKPYYDALEQPPSPVDPYAAEAPVIRTSRSSRGTSALRPKASKGDWRKRASFAFRQESTSPAGYPPNLLSPTEDDIGQLRRIVSNTSTLGPPSVTSSERPSMDYRPQPPRTENGYLPTSPVNDYKGKARTRAVSPVKEVSSGDEWVEPSSQPAKQPKLKRERLIVTEQVGSGAQETQRPSAVTSRRPSAVGSMEGTKSTGTGWRSRRRDRNRQTQAAQDESIIGDDTGFVVVRPTVSERPSESVTSTRIGSAWASITASRAASRDGSRNISPEDLPIPSRTSSLRANVSPPKIKSRSKTKDSQSASTRRRGTDASERQGAQSGPRTRPRAPSAETVNLDMEAGDLDAHVRRQKEADAAAASAAAAVSGAQPPKNETSLEVDEDNDVTKRIRELKAANERRKRDLDASVVEQHSPRSIVQDTPASPRSITRSLQMQQPSTTIASIQLKEAAKIKEKTLDPESRPSSAYKSIKESRLGVPSNASVSSPVEGRPSQSISRPSHDSMLSADRPLASPVLSRSSSKAKRWSFSESIQNITDSPARSHRRVDSHDRAGLGILQAPLFEERRDSMESIRQSVENFLQSPRLSRKIPAADDFSRQIAFSEVGDPEGHVVFCCVGMGLTRYIMAYYEELAMSLRLRLITPDRPGVGDSTAYSDNTKTPLSWPDDVRAITRYLGIQHFSLLAHSAGAVYALATAIRMPERISSRVHLLAPWIPPSQMVPIGIPSSSSSTPSSLPRSQRFLRILPTSFLKFSSSNFMGRNNIVGTAPKSSSSSKRSKNTQESSSAAISPRASTSVRSVGLTAPPSVLPSARQSGRNSPDKFFQLTSLGAIADISSTSDLEAAVLSASQAPPTPRMAPAELNGQTRQQRYDTALTPAVWDLATRKSNPAVDLIVCLERNRAIGFRYADVSQSVVIHHGTKDTRVPIENVKWLAGTMRNAEVRALEGEGHGLMASAGVMSQVLVEISKEREGGAKGSGRDELRLGDDGYYAT